FRRIVDVAFARVPAEVWRKLQPIVDDHDARRPDMTVCETVLVKIRESTQNRAEHLQCFFGRERTLGKNLGEDFVGILGYNIEQTSTIEFTASGVEERHQVGMGERRGKVPWIHGGTWIHSFGREDFDCGFSYS